jgi:hypothetical protein
LWFGKDWFMWNIYGGNWYPFSAEIPRTMVPWVLLVFSSKPRCITVTLWTEKAAQFNMFIAILYLDDFKHSVNFILL